MKKRCWFANPAAAGPGSAPNATPDINFATTSAKTRLGATKTAANGAHHPRL